MGWGGVWEHVLWLFFVIILEECFLEGVSGHLLGCLLEAFIVGGGNFGG